MISFDRLTVKAGEAIQAAAADARRRGNPEIDGAHLLGALLEQDEGIVIPVLKLFALPLRILTLGLATLAINLVVLFGVIALAQNLDLGVTSDGFWSTLLGALVLTVLSSIISALVRD